MVEKIVATNDAADPPIDDEDTYIHPNEDPEDPDVARYRANAIREACRIHAQQFQNVHDEVSRRLSLGRR